MTRTAASLCMLMLITAPATALASATDHPEPSTGAKILDAALVRPLSLGLAAASTGVFLGLLPLTTLTGVGPESTYLMVIAPWRFTEARHLGDFTHYRDGLSIYATRREASAR